MLSFTTLGSFHIAWQNVPIKGMGSGKTAALLVYLVMRPGMHRRETIADLFWPELGGDSARLNLRQSLFHVRDVLREASGLDFILADRHYVGFNATTPHRVDALELEATTSEHLGVLKESGASLRRMGLLADLYRGPFLTGITLSDCREFNNWIQLTGESLHLCALDLLARLAAGHESRKDYRTALSYVLRYIELEPWSESGHSRAMRLYALNGQRDLALRQYEHCVRLLKEEMGLLPGPELQNLAESIRRHEIAPVNSREALLPAEERRQVTVMYCEFMAAGIGDPEETMERLLTPQTRCRAVVRKYSGHVVQNHGGGLLCYFGYPLALENSALFAVRAAREIALGSTAELGIGIGVHSGLMITGIDLQLPDPLGKVSSTAIAMSKQARGGEVIVSRDVCRRVDGYFHFVRVASHSVLGQFSQQEPEAFRISGESGATSRLAAAQRLTPLTGRQKELAVLMDAWEQARPGVPRALLLSGEPGVGKSRLAKALMDWIEEAAGEIRELRCFPETRHSVLYPIIVFFESLCDFEMGDTPETKLVKLDNLLQNFQPPLDARGLPLLAWMMELPSDLLARRGLESRQANSRESLCQLLIEIFCHLADRHPTLLVVEDLHWADELTLEVLVGIATRRTPVPLLMLLTSRPKEMPAWPGLEVLQVAPLPPDAVASLVSEAPRPRARASEEYHGTR